MGASRRGNIDVPFESSTDSNDSVKLIRLDLVGTPYERGYATGILLSEEIVAFLGPALNKFFVQKVMSIDVSQFPEPIQSVLRALQLKGATHAPELFNTALSYVWEQEKSFVPSYINEEIAGIADGLCHNIGKISTCDPTEWISRIQQMNMLPELIRMACTAFGAWGPSTPSFKGLVQLRALDFGPGPWVNFTVITTHRYNNSEGSQTAFTTVSFPAFVGVITGISQSGIGISQKVWTTNNDYKYLPGGYKGMTDVFVLRHILENSKSRADAESFLQSIPRTWAIWIGIGDYTSLLFDLVAFSKDNVTAYNDETMPQMSGQPLLKGIAYVDKHP